MRPPEFRRILEARRDGGPFDQAEYERVLRRSVIDVVRNQADAGIDIVSDGEFGKSIHWAAYVLNRMGGLEYRPTDYFAASPMAQSKDMIEFPDFYPEYMASQGFENEGAGGWECTGALRTRARPSWGATSTTSRPGWRRSTSSPGSCRSSRRRASRASAGRRALRDRGGVHLRGRRRAAGRVRGDPRRRADPPDRRRVPAVDLRPHGPARDDGGVPGVGAAARRRAEPRAARACPRTRSATTSAGGASTRRTSATCRRRTSSTSSCRSTRAPTSSRWRTPATSTSGASGRTSKLPDGKVLIPGVITHQTNVVEHPELVAERLTRLAKLVGRENVQGGHRLRVLPGAVRRARARVDPVGEAAVAGRGRRDLDARALGRRARLTFAFVQDAVVGRA